MLVLTRKAEESITVTDTVTGEELVFTITQVRGDKAKVGIDASQRFRIVRTELLETEESEPQEGIIPVTPPVSASA